MDTREGLPVILFPTETAWEEWLAANHATAQGVWLKLGKKASGVPSVNYAEALDVALCYGWIDGKTGSLDARFYLQRFSPRGPRSRWSQINQGHIERLTAGGRMRPAGLAQVERAKADGRWDAAYEPPSRATVPDDLQAALDRNPAATAAFAGLNRTNRNAVLYRVADARRPETRARRIAQFVQMLAEGKGLQP